MSLFANLLFWIPLTLFSLILLGLFYLEIRAEVKPKTARRAFLVILILALAQIAAEAGYLYWRLRHDEFGKFLLPPSSDYYYRALWTMSSSLVFALVIGLVIILVLVILRRIFKANLVDAAGFYLLLLTIVIVGPSSAIILIIVSFFLMIFFLVGYSLRQKKFPQNTRLNLSPFLLMTAFAILVLSNFDFYPQMLQFLHLI